MNTLIIAISLLSVQPPSVQLDSQWLDLQNIREHVRAYVAEDVASVSQMIKGTLQESIDFTGKLYAPKTQLVNIDQATTCEDELTAQVK